MHPIAFTIGPLTVRWYGALMAIAIGISVVVAYIESRRKCINGDDVLDMGIVAIICGILGSRIGWILTSPDALWYLAHPLRILAIWEGGLSYFAAIVGGVLGATWMIRRRNMDWWQMADIAAPLLALSFGIGKIGCWLNGCCHGTVTASSLGVIFTDPLSECELLGQSVWPAQLFNSLSGFAAFAILYWIVARHKRFTGQVFVWYLYLYGTTSFAIEFFRYIPIHVLGLTPNQWTGVIIVVLGLIASAKLGRRKATLPTTPATPQAAGQDDSQGDAAV